MCLYKGCGIAANASIIKDNICTIKEGLLQAGPVIPAGLPPPVGHEGFACPEEVPRDVTASEPVGARHRIRIRPMPTKDKMKVNCWKGRENKFPYYDTE